MNCKECKLYLTCTTLCQDAEAYVNQDYVEHDELYLPTEVLDTMPDDSRWVDSISDSTHLTRTESKIVTLLGFGLSRADVANLLKMDRKALRMHILRLRKKIEEL